MKLTPGLLNLGGFSAGHPIRITYFVRHVCGIEAAQFEINEKYRIIERKPDSSVAIEELNQVIKLMKKTYLK